MLGVGAQGGGDRALRGLATSTASVAAGWLAVASGTLVDSALAVVHSA